MGRVVVLVLTAKKQIEVRTTQMRSPEKPMSPQWSASNEEAGLCHPDGTVLAGRVTYASGEQREFTDPEAYLQTIREELPYRDTTGFRHETLTDAPAVRKAVDDLLLDFAGEANPRRACNYGLTEAGKRALREAADPERPHTYAWFVLTDCNTPEEQLQRDLTLEEAIRVYQESGRPEKRLGVTKDATATVDLVHSQDREQRFFEDYHKLERFRDDPVIAAAVETLHQELDGPEAVLEMGGY